MTLKDLMELWDNGGAIDIEIVAPSYTGFYILDYDINEIVNHKDYVKISELKIKKIISCGSWVPTRIIILLEDIK